MTFEQWINAVDRLMLSKIGFTHDDITDQTWHDWYDSEMTPREAVREALANEGMLV